MSFKKVIFKGLGPTGNVTYKGKLIEDGAIVEIETDVANAYIKSHLAYEVKSEAEVIKIQNQVVKNKERRKEVLEEASQKKEGEK